jgi:hypothetical protein
LLISYSEAVRGFTRDKNADSRTKALEQYEQLKTRLPTDDPRLKTVEQLKGMLG